MGQPPASRFSSCALMPPFPDPFLANQIAVTSTTACTQEVRRPRIARKVSHTNIFFSGTKVHDLMAKLIDEYFTKHLEIPFEEAVTLHQEYYKNYGLAIEGLMRHHKIDPLDYNTKVDDALPLEGIIQPNPELRALLEDIDKSKVTMWLFTNAYKTHGKRVVRLLGIDDLFDGLTFCDYGQQPLICKPDPRMYEKAMREAGIEQPENCFFVGKQIFLIPDLPSHI